MNRALLVCATSGLITALVSCAHPPSSDPPVHGSVLVSPRPARIGAPLSLTYELDLDATTSSTATMATVHFYDSQGELLWADDHAIPLPATHEAGTTHVSYVRWTLVPAHVQAGPILARLRVQSRESERTRQRSTEIDLARFEVRKDVDEIPIVFATGWHGVEPGSVRPLVEWNWSGTEGTVAFANPHDDVHVALLADQPAAIGRSQQVAMIAAGNVVDRFSIEPGGQTLRQVTLHADQLGTSPITTLSWRVDQTFTPSSIPGLGSNDTRALGMRVAAIHVASAHGD